MNNLKIIPAVCLIFTGCASLKYPGWEQVAIVDSVFKQPCQYLGEEVCYGHAEDCPDWQKKRATVFKANTVVSSVVSNSIYTAKIVGEYFSCKPGNPLFIAKPNSIWLVKPNKFRPGATQMEYEQAEAECRYDSHKATIDNSRHTPTQFGYAGRLDAIKEDLRRLKLDADQLNLYSECLIAKGFVHSRSAAEADLAARNQYCPELDNTAAPCFVPNAQ